MTSSLESRLAEDLRHEAEQVHEPPGLSARVIARGHAVRRRRALAVGAIGVAVIVVALSATLGNGPTTSAPPAGPSPTASPTAKLSDAMRALPKGAPPAVDYVVGTTAHFGGRTFRLPGDWVVDDLVRTGGRWIMIVEAPGVRMVVSTTGPDDLSVLDREDAQGLAVDPTGRYLAWGSEHQMTSRVEHLTEYDLTTDKVIARRIVHQPVTVQGWSKQGVIASYRLTPGGSPVVWDPKADTLTTVWGGADAGPTFVTYTLNAGGRGPRWVLSDSSGGCGVVIARPGDQAAVRGCAHPLGSPAAFFDGGRLLAVSSDGPEIRVLDRLLADTGVAYSLPKDMPTLQVVPVGTRLLVVVADPSDGSSHVLGCADARPCDRAVDAGPHQTVVLAKP